MSRIILLMHLSSFLVAHLFISGVSELFKHRMHWRFERIMSYRASGYHWYRREESGMHGRLRRYESYSYALDDDTNTTYTCASTDYQITFCPEKSINTTSYMPNSRNTTDGTANNSRPSSMPEIRPNATSRRKWGLIIAGVVGGVLTIISFVVIVVLRVRWSKSEDTEEDEEDDHVQQVPGMPVREMSEVQLSMRGTPGYLAPEWHKVLGHVTVKVDVYSFGIVLLEVVCARRNVDHSQPESAFHLLRMLQNKAEYILGYLEEYIQSDREEIIRMLEVAAWCLQDDPERRPPMSTVVTVLEGVMEVDSNLVYKFSHALTPPPGVDAHISSAPPQASVLSNPR
ncbi:hypothetical protein OIU77_009674 [Salix suchowensis]|uniref:Protein kinase domain-containing protein n=1 Tax=Salix suchowensis TaxID=1278906 RepID=A0ABQ9AFX4_9ROSI|nr:hypothetical protein OIU77_009674 [Salix suchowensis]